MADGHITVTIDPSMEELRKSVAAILGEPNTWPEHGNVPLAVAATVALLHAGCCRMQDEIDRMRVRLDACMASRDALRDWAQECRNQVLYLLAQQDSELGRVADGLGQASSGLLGPNVNSATPRAA